MGIAVVVLVAAAGAYVWYVQQPAAMPEVPLTFTSAKTIESSVAHRAVADLPAVDGLPDRAEQRAINAAMRQPMLQALAAIERKALADRPDLHGDGIYTFRSTFTVERFTDRAVSVRFMTEEYAGGAHPRTTVSAYTYDFAQHRAVVLDDLFARQDEPYLLTLTRLTNGALLTKFDLGKDADPDLVAWVDRGTAPDTRHFEVVTFNDRGTTFWFDPGEVAPIAAGVLAAEIPYEELRGIVRAGSVLEEYLVQSSVPR